MGLLKFVAKWMNGVLAHLFAPNQYLNRSEAAAILVRAMNLKNSTAGMSNFKDIEGHWAKNDIEIAAQYGIVKGTGIGQFSPNKLISRQEMAVMFDRILNQLEDVSHSENPYSDISPESNSWSYNAIIKLTHHNIFAGNPDGTFGAKAYTTRGVLV